MKKTYLAFGIMLIMLLIISTSLIAATGDTPVPADYDGDGDADIVIYRDLDGSWRQQEGNWPGTSSTIYYYGSSDFIPVQADYNGDGDADIAVFRESDRKWCILYSPDYTDYRLYFGELGDTPVPADYDGDGDDDIAVFRESNGKWLRQEGNWPGTSSPIFYHGQYGDTPVPADYDGDGKDDIAIFRESTGLWNIRYSSDYTYWQTYFGASGDTPVPADYDGDGNDDIAIFRPSTGLWEIIYSSTVVTHQVTFGQSGDTPVPADYSGDGKANIAVFTESTGEWSILYLYYKATTAGNWNTTATWKTSTTVDGSYTTDATETPTASNSGGIIIDADVSITANVTIDQTTINSGKTLTVADGITVTVRYEVGTNLDIKGTLSIGTGIVDVNGTFDATGGAVTFTGAGDLKLGGTVISLGTFTKSTSTVTYDGGDQTVDDVDYSSLSFIGSTTGSTKTFADGITKIDNHISLTDDITLTGSSESAVTVQVPTPGTTDSRIFIIDNASGKTINISNMTIKGGNIGANYGGGIYFSSGTLNLESVTVSGSIAAYGGGIQVAGGEINIDKCTIKDNEATTYFGGGVRVGNSASATVVVTNSTFSGNSSDDYGSGFSSGSGNTITITNSTFSYNTSDGIGGGISLSSPSTLTSLTIANNHSDNDDSGSEIGGGLYFYDGTHIVINCIIANNYRGSGTSTGDDYYYRDGTLTDNGYNVVEFQNGSSTGSEKTFTATTNFIYTGSGTDWTHDGGTVSGSLYLSSILALNNNPNGTFTLTYTNGSSIGIDDGTGSDPDQRGATVYNGTKDIGAYEWQGSEATLPVILSIFTAQFIENTPTLYWETQSEVDNMGWFVYRNREEDFTTSEKISEFIEGHGTTSQQQSYLYEDRIQNPEVGDKYYYWLESIDFSGMVNHYDKVAVLTIPEQYDPGSGLIPEPVRYGLFQNNPNPFIESTKISFNLPETARVDLNVYNIKGQLVKKLYSGLTSKRTIMWNGRDEQGKKLENGMYLYKLMINGRATETKKLILMK